MPTKNPAQIKHPYSKEIILGFKLREGDILQEGDLYPSADGKWVNSNLKNIRLKRGICPDSFFWVRPIKS